MSEAYSATKEIATIDAVKSVATRFDATAPETTCDRSDANWFPYICKVLLDRKAGTALHYTTGFNERSCQRYAAGTVEPPASFLRALLRSQQGHVWLSAIMDGSEQPWWRELQAARDLCIKFKIEAR